MKDGFRGQRSYSMPAPLLAQLLAHPLCQGLYLTDIGFYPAARLHKRARRAGSPQYILLYCVHGEGWYQIGGEGRRALKANQWIILPAETAHRYGADDATPWTIYWLHFAGSQAAALYTYLCESSLGKPITITFADERLRLFEAIFAQLMQLPEPDSLVQACLHLPHFLATLAPVGSLVAQPTAAAEVVANSITYMRQHLERAVTVPELAKQAGLSGSHYSALFRAQTGRPPIMFFNSLKVQRACEQLLHTALPVKDIAGQLGVEDAYYFSRLFTKVMGSSPRQFRQAHAG
ncbi:helix-turn-helix domain-containing protein [Hymenobacter sp. HMF4947]|uniref:Helix-turn-helix domain-containing protein n=1 Tax=Hymenobacter ginkgonis TaxID=2682976 RepID=A0A7K1TH06_9BACT|nr:AraC family transcriptional regulator [Hymenobacter ginkgonis]MVN77602.1 helix-turn-helix domain-containing protein [Hymenobacter ginkgonis]